MQDPAATQLDNAPEKTRWADGPVLRASDIHKDFAGVRALDGVSIDIWPGEVHVLMGENGAGKSTLMNILAGMLRPDAGHIQLRGQRVVFNSPHDAIRHGIAMIHQELMPIPEMTIAENLLLGREPVSGISGWIDRQSMEQEARRLLGLLGMPLNIHRKVSDLSVAEIQTVEIAKTLGRDAAIVIMDEPTSAISDREVETLFTAIGKLKERGVAIVYISHKMDEIFRIADRITVLRDGAYIGTHQAADFDEGKLIAMMVGRELLSLKRPTNPRVDAEVVLEVRGLEKSGVFRDINFTLRRGEILGFAGLMGAGRTEVMDALFGLDPADSGEIFVNAKAVRIRRPADAMSQGIGMVTEDRKGCGIVPTLSVAQNATLASLERCCVGNFIVCERERVTAEKTIRQFGIKTSGGRQAISQLSGGNQQKVVIARTLLAEPSIIILDEPTRGIDIGAKAEVYAIINRLADEGKTVILVSSELPEILSLSDRIIVLRQGVAVAELVARETSQEEILKYAMPE